MKHISENLRSSALSESTKSSNAELGAISQKWIDALFARFSRIWPTAWANIISDHRVEEISLEWQEGLAGLDGQQIKRGIEVCRTRHKWPPTIAEFRSAAEGGGSWEHRSAAYRIQDPKRLLKADPSEGSRRRATAAFEEMRKRSATKLA